jgi:spore germination cell wall hydrolase CwlJ-like protein
MKNGRMIPLAVAASLIAALPARALAPPPPPEATDRLVVSTPQPVRVAPAMAAPDLHCLALNVYFEARGQPALGQQAVAHVTLNRVATKGFPSSVCGVVFQGVDEGACQFGWVCAGRRAPRHSDRQGWNDAWENAARAVGGADDPTGGALYFHGIHERPRWGATSGSQRVVIGGHVFIRGKVGGKRPVRRMQEL